jgi:exopolyphosphatase/guanosine-5'-triphosphate,3'-diphosphate pyrophosphatase
MPRFAALDVGTNTVLLLVAEAQGGSLRPVLERMEITRLGRGVDRTGRLAEDAMADTAGAIARFAAEARALGVQGIACVATSAARDAQNGAEFLSRVKREAGLEVEIIAGDLEAELSYASARRELGALTPLVVLDIGGGSTEFVYGAGDEVLFKQSFNVGSVRLTERLVTRDPPLASERRAMQELLDETFAALPPPPPGHRLVGIAGTVTTVCAVARGVEPYDPAQVHLARLSAAEVHRECDRCFSLDLAGRRALKGMHPRRADVIAAGALILERAMARLNAPEVVVSDRGLRWGLLYHRFAGALAERE